MESDSDIASMEDFTEQAVAKTLDEIDSDEEQHGQEAQPEPDDETVDKRSKLKKEFEEKFKGYEEDFRKFHMWNPSNKEYWSKQDCISDFGPVLVRWERPVEQNNEMKVAVSVHLGCLVHVFSKHCMPLYEFFHMQRDTFYMKLYTSGVSTFDRAVASNVKVLAKLLDHAAQHVVCKLSKKTTFLQRWDPQATTGAIKHSLFQTRVNNHSESAKTLDGKELMLLFINEVKDEEDGYSFEATLMEQGFKSIFGTSPDSVGFSSVGVVTQNQIICEQLRIICRFQNRDENSGVYNFMLVSCYPNYPPFEMKCLSLGGLETKELIVGPRQDTDVVRAILRENERLDYPWTVDFHVKLAVSILNGGKHSKFRIHSEYCPPDVPHKDGTYIKFDGSLRLTVKGIKIQRFKDEDGNLCLRTTATVRTEVTPAVVLASFAFFMRFVSTELEDKREHLFNGYTFCDNLSYFCLHTGYALCTKPSCLVCADDVCDSCLSIE